MIMEFYYVGVIVHFILVLYYVVLTRFVEEIYQEEIDEDLPIILMYAVLSSVLSWISSLLILGFIIRFKLKLEEYLLIEYLKEVEISNRDKLILENYVDFPSIKFVIKEINKLVDKYNIEHIEYYYDRFEKEHSIYIGPTNVLDNILNNDAMEIDKRFIKIFDDELLIFYNIKDKYVFDYEILICSKNKNN